MKIETLPPPRLQEALQSRLEQNSRLGDRQTYLGASEVGGCLRRVLASKRHPEALDPASMGRMLAGRALENEVIQMVRLALAGTLRNTGRAQLEARHPHLPWIAHPDGRITDPTQGDGVLEVKTASSATFKRYAEQGLPEQYLDQVQTQMGLTGLSWGLVVLVSRESLAEMASFHVSFDPEHFRRLEERAERFTLVLLGNCDSPDPLPSELPGEPERGYCHTCPYAHDCPALQLRRAKAQSGEIPDLLRLQLECQMEELANLESEITPMQDRVSSLRNQMKNALHDTGTQRIRLESGVVQLVESSRTSFDSKCLQRESPEIYSRFLKTSTFTNLRVTHHGDNPCQSMAS